MNFTKIVNIVDYNLYYRCKLLDKYYDNTKVFHILMEIKR